MALQNHPALFTGGYERIDTRPHIALYAQLKAREQARDDAFDQYMRGLNTRINPAGMRNNERAVFEDKLKQWQDSGIQNREAIRNPRKDGGMAAMNFERGYQELQNIIARSKGIEELKKPAVDVMTDPNKFDRVNKERMMAGLQSTDQDLYVKDPASGQWVDNPNWRGFSVSDIEFRSKPFDQDKFFKGLDDVKPSKEFQNVVPNPKDLTKTVTTISEFTPDDKEVIAYRAIGAYGQDESFKDFIKQLPQQDRDALAQVYKESFGIDPTSEAQLAAAYALKGKQQKSEKVEEKEDLFAQRKALARLNDALAKGRMSMRREWQKTDKGTQDLWVDKQLQTIINEGKAGGTIQYIDNGKYKTGHKLPLDPNLANALKVGSIVPNALRLTAEGKIQPIYLRYGDDNKPKQDKKTGAYEIDEELSVPLTYEQIKAAYSRQFGTKQANIEMGAGSEDEGGIDETGILD